MTPGFTIAAALAVLLAIGFAVGPLLLRGEYRQTPPVLLLALLIAIPTLAWVTYRAVGTPEGILPAQSEVTMIRAELINLARQVERNPDDSHNWIRMGTAYKELQEYSSANHAFRRALYIDEGNPYIQVELAETLLFASGRRQLPQESVRLLHQALDADPGQQKALWLLGLDALQRGDNDQAITWLERLDRTLPDGSVRDTIRGYLAQARGHAGISGAAEPDRMTGTAGSPAPVLNVSLSLDQTLADRIRGDEAVFIIVRAAEGSRVPLAVHRLNAGELPVEIDIDGGNSMMGGSTIADVPAIRVTARISHAGTAEAREGDFEGQSDELPVSEQISARVHIDRIL